MNVATRKPLLWLFFFFFSILLSLAIVDVEALPVFSHAVFCSDKSLKGWSNDNNYGVVGDGTTTARSSPTNVVMTSFGSSAVKQIANGIECGFALLEDGRLFSWGRNYKGILGDGTTTQRNSPVQVGGALASKVVTQVVVFNDYYAAAALTDDGKVYGWGFAGYVGDGTSTPDKPSPVAMTGDISSKNVIQIAAGANHGIALTSEGAIYAWGMNTAGEVTGVSTGSISYAPVLLSNLGQLATKTVTFVAAGFRNSFAVTSDGLVYAWGRGADYMLGTGGTVDRVTPTQVSTGAIVGKVIKAIFVGIAQSSAGLRTYALSNTGELFVWGKQSTNGELGIGSSASTTQASPVKVSGLTGETVVQVYYSFTTNLALTASGKVYVWGSCGILCGSTSSNTPIATSVLTSIQMIPGWNNLAIAATCTFTCFGLSSTSSSVCNYRNGTCTATNTCTCNSGYSGSECTIPSCSGISATSSTVCNNGNGTCVAKDTCACNTGYSGADCSIYSCYGVAYTSPQVCNNGNGTCIAKDTCTCNSGYSGSDCSSILCFGVPSTSGTVCTNGRGACVAPNVCSCNPITVDTEYGYDVVQHSGSQCETEVSRQGYITKDITTTVTLSTSATNYTVLHDVTVTDTGSLTIPPSTSIRLQGRIQVTGTLQLQGSKDFPIIVTLPSNQVVQITVTVRSTGHSMQWDVFS